MSAQQLTIVLVAAGGILLLGVFTLFARTYRSVSQDMALIVSRMGAAPLVTFTGAMVVPFIHRCEVVDLSVKTWRPSASR